MEIKELKKMNKTAIIVAAILAVILIGSIAFSVFGGKDKEPDSTETTHTDKTALEVKMKQRYIFTNNIAALTDFSNMFESTQDASECTAKLVRFEYKENLRVLDEKALESLTDAINIHAKADELKAIGSEEIPSEEGIYRSVLEIEDAYDNASYEEVYVIIDHTAASINVVADQVIEVEKEKLAEAPVLDESLYKGLDNVDGEISFNELSTELVLRDEAKHEWIVKVSYTDRAGNESKAEFLITVVEKSASSNAGTNNQVSGNQNNTTTKPNGGSTTKPNGTSTKPSGGTTYDPMDANKDGYVSGDEEMGYITPEKQKCIDAGYGVVVEMDGGEWYAVLMKDSDHTINGKEGSEILREYLHERGLEGTVGGCWINSEKEWYWYTAQDIREIDENGGWEIIEE